MTTVTAAFCSELCRKLDHSSQEVENDASARSPHLTSASCDQSIYIYIASEAVYIYCVTFTFDLLTPQKVDCSSGHPLPREPIVPICIDIIFKISCSQDRLRTDGRTDRRTDGRVKYTVPPACLDCDRHTIWVGFALHLAVVPQPTLELRWLSAFRVMPVFMALCFV